MTGFRVLRLRQLHTGDRDYGRIQCNEIEYIENLDRGEMKDIFVPQRTIEMEDGIIMPHNLLHVSLKSLPPGALGDKNSRTSYEKYKLINWWPTPFSSALKVGKKALVVPQLPLSLKLNKFVSEMSCIIVFDAPSTKEKIVIMVGTDELGEVGFHAALRSANDSLASIKSLFKPQPQGGGINLGEHMVNVYARNQLQSGAMVYRMNLTFQRTGLPQ